MAKDRTEVDGAERDDVRGVCRRAEDGGMRDANGGETFATGDVAGIRAGRGLGTCGEG